MTAATARLEHAAGPASARAHGAHLKSCCSAAVLFGLKSRGVAETAGTRSHALASPASHRPQDVPLLSKPRRLIVLAAHPGSKKKKHKGSKGPASLPRQQTPQHSAAQQQNRTQQQRSRQQHQQRQLDEPQQHSEANLARSPHQQKLQNSTQQQHQQVQPQNKVQQQDRQHQNQHPQQQPKGSEAGQSTSTPQGQHVRQQQQQHSTSTMQPAAATASAVKETANLLAAAKIDEGNTGKASNRAASIHFKLAPHAYREFRAAGVVLYDYDTVNGQPANTRLLLVRELGQVWCLPAGKLNKSLDGTQHPEATGARELEEETHGLIPAVVSKAVLSECPQFYWKDGKMVLYFVRCTGGEQLPDMAAARLAAGKAHPAAMKIDQLAWTSLDKIMSGRGGKGLERRLVKAATAAVAGSPPAPIGTSTAAAEQIATEGPDPATIPAPSQALVGSATAQQQAEKESDGASSDVMQQGQPPEQQQQQQERGDSGRLMLRSTLVVTKADISKWLEVLVTGDVVAPGLVVKPLQLQQQENSSPAVDLLQAPVVQATSAARPAPAALGVKAGSSRVAGPDAAGGVSGVLGAATAASAATAAALQAAGLAAGGSGGPSTGVLGDQPWALHQWRG